MGPVHATCHRPPVARAVRALVSHGPLGPAVQLRTLWGRGPEPGVPCTAPRAVCHPSAPGGAIRTLTLFFPFCYGIHSLLFGGYPPTAIGYPPTAIGYPPTAIGYTPTAIGYTPTAIGHPPAAIGYPPAAIVGRIGHSEFFFLFITAPPAPPRATIAAAITQIDSAGGTDIIKALLVGEQQLMAGAVEKPKALVLLTDGALATDLAAHSLQWAVLNELLVRFQAKGWRIHVVALAVRDPRLPAISERTGGICQREQEQGRGPDVCGAARAAGDWLPFGPQALPSLGRSLLYWHLHLSACIAPFVSQ